MTQTIGLDFGTGNSVLAVLKNNQMQVLSPVSSDLLVGPHGQINSNPDHLSAPPPGFQRESSLKRRLLTLSGEQTDQRARLIELAAARIGYLYQSLAVSGNEPVSPGHNIVKAVLTCPANTGQAYRDILLEIGRRAGLPEVDIVDEPTAAAVHHGLKEIPTENERWLVIDWGCGTCDVSLIERKNGERDLLVQGVQGDNHLGGLDMDFLLRNHLAQRYHFKPETCDLWAVETLKKQLSDAEQVTDSLALITGQSLAVQVTRKELERLIAPLLQRMQTLITTALTQQHWNDVDYIIATGGPMLMPVVRQAIANALDWNEEEINWDDPLTSVAQGAAKLADLKRRGGLLVTNKVTQSIGVRVVQNGGDDAYHRIITRGETRPVTRTVQLATSVDLQDVIAIELREGDNLSAQSNTLLGRLNVVVRPENKGAVGLKLNLHLTDSGEKQVWIEPVGDPNTVRHLETIGLRVERDTTGRVDQKEARWGDPVDEFQAQAIAQEVDPDTARQIYERLKIKYHPDRQPDRRDHWNDRLKLLDQAFGEYLAAIEARIRASTLPDLPWDNPQSLQQVLVDEVLARRLTHCLAHQIGGQAVQPQLVALLKRFPDYRRVLASYLSAVKRNPVLQTLLAEDDRPHVGLVVLLQNVPDKPIRERHEVLKAAYRLDEVMVRKLLGHERLDFDKLYDYVREKAPPATNPVVARPPAAPPPADPIGNAGIPPRVVLQFDYRDGNTHISGNTFPIKDFLKNKFQCRWDGVNKQWVALNQHITEKDIWPNA